VTLARESHCVVVRGALHSSSTAVIRSRVSNSQATLLKDVTFRNTRFLWRTIVDAPVIALVRTAATITRQVGHEPLRPPSASTCDSSLPPLYRHCCRAHPSLSRERIAGESRGIRNPVCALFSRMCISRCDGTLFMRSRLMELHESLFRRE
jgi:hypothetical protein